MNPHRYAEKHGVKLGANVELTAPVSWGSEPYLIAIGDGTKLSQNVTFITHDGGVHVLRHVKSVPNFDLIKPISIGKNCFIGYGATILYGTVVGDNTIIGANAVVKGTLEANSIYAGVPAKRICGIEEFYLKHRSEFTQTKLMSPRKKRAFLEGYLNEEKH